MRTASCGTSRPSTCDSLPVSRSHLIAMTESRAAPADHVANRLARFLEPWRRAATERAGRDDERARSQVGALIRRTNRKRQRPFPAASWCADDDQGSFRRAQHCRHGRLSPPAAKRRRSCSTRERRARAVQGRRQRQLRQRCALPAATSLTRDGGRRRHRQRRERSPSRRLRDTRAAASDIRPRRSAARQSPTIPARSRADCGQSPRFGRPAHGAATTRRRRPMPTTATRPPQARRGSRRRRAEGGGRAGCESLRAPSH